VGILACLSLVYMVPAVSSAAAGDKARTVGTRQSAHVERVGRTDVAAKLRAEGGTANKEFGPWLNSDDKDSGAEPTARRAPWAHNRRVRVHQNHLGWEGLDHADQRLAGGGNQFSLEPPDQGLCVGGQSPNDPSYGPEVVESVNDAITFYDSKSNKLAQTLTLSEFYGIPPTINRTTGEFGPFVTDPKCYFDVDTQRWFHSVAVISLDPVTGDFVAPSYVYFAVSTSAEALGPYNIYRIETTDASGPGCPCFGDQPLIGADKYGFYISTAEYNFAGSNFNGPQIYALDKQSLEAGTLGPVVHISGITHVADGRTTGTVQPATSPGRRFETAANGTEYFLSSYDCLPTDGCPVAPGSFHKITVWALTNTQTLATSSPNLSLSLKDLNSERLATPIPQTQKPGPRPLGNLVGAPTPEVNANDARMNQVVYADGLLWSGVNTAVKHPARDGIGYFIVRPWVTDGHVHGTIHKQGYVSAAHANLSFPSVGVSPNGRGVIAMSLMGPRNFPSAAQIHISKSGVWGPVQITRQGFRPEDGFTCYDALSGIPNSLCRWGDYSASVGTPGGTIYSATEFIGDNARTFNANWSTFIWPTRS
jgi:hypothetical protein